MSNKVIENLYSQFLEDLANKDNKPKIISCDGALRASMFLSKMFSIATNNINMLTGSMNEQDLCKSDFEQSLEAFLKRDAVKLRVVLLDEPESNNRLLSLIKKFKAKAEVRQAPKDFTFKRDKVYHFTTADNKMYRFESDTKKLKGFASLEDAESVERLNKSFEKLFSASRPVTQAEIIKVSKKAALQKARQTKTHSPQIS